MLRNWPCDAITRETVRALLLCAHIEENLREPLKRVVTKEKCKVIGVLCLANKQGGKDFSTS